MEGAHNDRFALKVCSLEYGDYNSLTSSLFLDPRVGAFAMFPNIGSVQVLNMVIECPRLRWRAALSCVACNSSSHSHSCHARGPYQGRHTALPDGLRRRG